MSRSNFVVLVAVLALLAGTAGVAQADLLVNWKFDDLSGSSAADATGHGYTATPNTAVTGFAAPTEQITGAIGKAFSFDKFDKNGLVAPVVSGSYNLTGMTNLTNSAWIYVDSTPSTSMDIIRIWDTDDSRAYCLCTQSSRVVDYFFYDPSSKQPYFSPSSVGADSWHQITGVYTGANNQGKIYLDGVLQDTTTTGSATNIQSTTGDVILGASFWNGVYGYNYFDGGMDDLGIWNEALTDEQVAAMYNAPTTFTADAAAGFYGQLDMQSLYAVFVDAEHDMTIDINGKTWQYMASSIGHDAGDAWTSGSDYFIRLGTGADTSGVMTAIPEPSTLALLAAGLFGLLAYAWKKRK